MGGKKRLRRFLRRLSEFVRGRKRELTMADDGKNVNGNRQEGDEMNDQGRLKELYRRWCLDAIVEVAHAVAKDLDETDRYRDLKIADADKLDDFAKVGTEKDWPDKSTRLKMYARAFGSSATDLPHEGESDWVKFVKDLHEAARNYIQRSPNASEEGLKRDFKNSAKDLRGYLSTIIQPKDVLERPYKRTQDIHGKAVNALSTDAIADAFRVGKVDGGWDKKGGNANAARLINAITSDLKPDTTGVLETRMFMKLQDMANYGSDSIADIMDSKDEDEEGLPILIQTVDNWKSATDDVMSDRG